MYNVYNEAANETTHCDDIVVIDVCSGVVVVVVVIVVVVVVIVIVVVVVVAVFVDVDVINYRQRRRLLPKRLPTTKSAHTVAKAGAQGVGARRGHQ